MPRPRPLPPELGRRFTVKDAAAAGVNRGRLHRSDLDRPFHGVRTLAREDHPDAPDTFAKQRIERRMRALDYAPRLGRQHVYSHETAIALFGGPLPLVREDGGPVDGGTLPVHVSTLGKGPLVRTAGVVGHRIAADTPCLQTGTVTAVHPSIAWAQLGSLDLLDIVAIGDYLCRVRRPGVGRTHVGRMPWTTIDGLRAVLAGGRRVGIGRLREAAELIREDSWSPRESMLRCRIVLAGLPEPLLNHDVFDQHGRFLGCVDMAYPHLKIAIEYQGRLHHASYATDVERIAALRAAGWTVIEVTDALYSRPAELIARIRDALRV